MAVCLVLLNSVCVLSVCTGSLECFVFQQIFSLYVTTTYEFELLLKSGESDISTCGNRLTVYVRADSDCDIEI